MSLLFCYFKTTSSRVSTTQPITFNTVGSIRRVQENGTSYLVAPAVMIVPGVLPGSKGPLMYTHEDTKEATESWNGMPVTDLHPFDPITGDPLSASSPGVLDRQGIGEVRRSRFDGRLRSEVWFNEDRTRTISPAIYDSLMKGKPINLSTGLFTKNEPAGLGSHHNGIPYTHYARGHKPDHLAILPGLRGACSLEDGCGVLINSSGKLIGVPSSNNKRIPEPPTIDKKDCGGESGCDCRKCSSDKVSSNSNKSRRTINALDKQGGELPVLSRKSLEAADFITLPKGEEGTNCSNCEYVRKKGEGHVCSNPKLNGQPVTDKNCCAYWDAAGTLRTWDKQKQPIGNTSMNSRDRNKTEESNRTVDNWGIKAWMASRAARKAEAEAKAAEDTASLATFKAAVHSEKASPDLLEYAAKARAKANSGNYEGIEDDHSAAFVDHNASANDPQLSASEREAHKVAARLHLSAVDAWDNAKKVRKKAKQLGSTKNAEEETYSDEVENTSSSNSDEVEDTDIDTMSRNQKVGYLVSNCDCWNEEEDFLNNLDDHRLTKLVEHAQQHKHLEAVADIAHTGFSDPAGQSYRLNYNTGGWERQQVVNDCSVCHECGGKMKGNKCEDCGYTEKTTTNDDEEDETMEDTEAEEKSSTSNEDEEEETDEEDEDTTNQVGASASSKTDAAYGASQEAERKRTKASHRKASNLHRAAAAHHEQEENGPMAATHKSKARYHAAKIRKATTNSGEDSKGSTTENMWTRAAWDASAEARKASRALHFIAGKGNNGPREVGIGHSLAVKYGVKANIPVGILHDKLEEEGDLEGSLLLRQQQGLEHGRHAQWHDDMARSHHAAADRARRGLRALQDREDTGPELADLHSTAARLHQEGAFLHREQAKKFWKADMEAMGIKTDNADCQQGQTAKQTGCTPKSGNGVQETKVQPLLTPPQEQEAWAVRVAKSIGRNKGTIAGLWTLGTIGGGIGLAKIGALTANPVLIAAGAGLISVGALTSLSSFGMIKRQYSDSQDRQFDKEKAEKVAKLEDYETRLARYEAYKRAHEAGIRKAIAEQAYEEGGAKAKAVIEGTSNAKSSPKITKEVHKALASIKGMSDEDIDTTLKAMIKHLPEMSKGSKSPPPPPDLSKNSEVHNVWTPQAREAAEAARKASQLTHSGTLGGGNSAASEHSHNAVGSANSISDGMTKGQAVEAHKDAAGYHSIAAMQHEKENNKPLADLHWNAASAHQEAAKVHGGPEALTQERFRKGGEDYKKSVDYKKKSLLGKLKYAVTGNSLTENDMAHDRDQWFDYWKNNGKFVENDREAIHDLSDIAVVQLHNAFSDKPHDDGSSVIGEDVDDEADGGANDGDTGDYPSGGKKGKKVRNAATLNAYLQSAPEELRGPLGSIVRDHNRYREQVVNSLKQVAEATNNETRKKLIVSKLSSNALTTEALEELLTLVGGPVSNQGSHIPEPIFTGVAGGAPNGYTRNGRNGHNPADVLQMPTINDWSDNWDEKEASAQ